MLALCLGGAKSGKSSFALSQAANAAAGLPVLFIATAEALDGEMERRIRRHRENRPSSCVTIEAPLDPERSVGLPGFGAVVVDCLTLWYANIIGSVAETDPDAAESRVRSATTGLLEACRRQSAPVYLVSNDVSGGIVPASALGRAFQDLAGIANQIIAAEADRVYYLVAGLPRKLK